MSSSEDEPTRAAQRGGKRKNSGRKIEIQGENVTKHTVTLDGMTKRKLKVIGDGNMSLGIRTAASIAFEKYQNEDPKP